MTRPAPVVPTIPSFNDLAKSLDPMLPKADYDMLRDKYWHDHVAPKVQNPTALGALYEQFRTQTERQPLLSKVDQLKAQVQMGLNSAVKELVAPLPESIKGGQLKGLEEAISANDENLNQIADREGFGRAAPRFIGSMIGMIPPTVALSMVASPAAELLANSAFKTARTIELANRALRGGLGFAAYEAASDQTGNRLMSGLRGFGIGASGDLLLGLPEFLRSEGIADGATIAKAALEGKPVGQSASEAVAEYVNNQAAVSQKEGNPNLFLQENLKVKGVHVMLSDPDGRPLNFPITKGKEDLAFNSINKWLDKGGTLDTVQWHPDDAATAQKVVRQLADQRNVKYDSSIFVRTNQAPELIQALQAKGVASETKGDLVSVPVTHIDVPKVELKDTEMIGDVPDTTLEAEQAKADVLTRVSAKARMDAGEMPKMSKIQAANIIKGFGGDPTKADLEAVMYMGEHELNRLYEVVQKQNVAQSGAEAGLAEERFGGGEKRVVDFVPKSKEPLLEADTELHPDSGLVDEHRDTGLRDFPLLKLLGFNRNTHQIMDLPIEGRPGLVRIVVPNTVMRAIAGDESTAAMTFENWQHGLTKLGVRPEEIAKLQHPNSPMIIMREGVQPQTIYHEGIHANLVNAELNPVRFVPDSSRGVATELAQGIGSHEGYRSMSFEALVDESFTYAAQAVRFNNKELLAKLAAFDRSEQHVIDYVGETAQSLLRASYAKLDAPGVRIFQRRLEDLVRRSSDAVFSKAQDGLRSTGDMLSFDADAGSWSIPTSHGKTAFKSLNDAWDYILDHETSDYTADPSFSLQVRGMRGGLTAGPMPGKNLPLPETPILRNEKGIGWTSINGWFRPFLPWVATLDRQVNRIASKTGTALPIFDAVKGVDNAVREGEQWLAHYTEKFGEALSSFSHEKQVTLFELLSMKPDSWEKAADKLRLTADEVKAAGNLVKVAKDFQADTHINVLEYLQNYYPKLKHNAWQADAVPGWGLLKNPRAQGFWEKAIQSGDLDPTDNHAGRFLKWTIKQGYEKKFTGKPLAALSKLVDLKAADGSYVLGTTRWPLTNYVKYMKGVPDTTATVLNKAFGQVQGFVANRFKEMNQYLPESLKLPEQFSLPSQAMNKLLMLSYAGGLALRPAVTVRDGLQVLITGLPVIGPETFGRGLARSMTREGWNFAEQSGALLRKTNIGEMYGDVFDEMPLDQKGFMGWVTRTSQKLLGPSRWGNNVARATVFNGTFTDALDAITKYKGGLINQDEFLKASHSWFLEPQLSSKFLVEAARKGSEPAELARQMALETVDATQWAYRRGAQPAMLRTGLGRILGQYGSWPLNYAEFMTNMGKKYSTYPQQAMKAAGIWAAVNYGASQAMEGIGADSSKWLWTSPASYTGGPQLDLVRDLAASYGSDDQAASARARVLRYPLNFVPASIAVRSMITAMEKHEDLSIGGKGFIRAMGFRPLDDLKKDPDIQEWLLEESGLTANPYKNRF